MYGVMWERENIEREGEREEEREMRKRANMETKGKHGNTFSLGTFISLSLSLSHIFCLFEFCFSKAKTHGHIFFFHPSLCTRYDGLGPSST